MIPQNTNALDSILRLGGLKNVSRRKVMPGEGIMSEYAEEPTDFSGISSQSQESINMPPNQIPNTPAPDLGIPISPQSYDVRANLVNSPQVDSGFFNKLGKSLAGIVQNKPSETNIPFASSDIRNNSVTNGETSPSFDLANMNAQPNKDEFFSNALNKYMEGQKDSSSRLKYPNNENLSPRETGAPSFIPQGIAEYVAPEQIPLEESMPGEEIPMRDTGAPSFIPQGIAEYVAPEQVPLEEPIPGEEIPKRETGAPSFVPQGIAEYVAPQSTRGAQEELSKNHLDQQKVDQEAMDVAQDPNKQWQTTVYGATDRFSNSPELVEQFSQYTGLNVDEALADQIKAYETIAADLNGQLQKNEAVYDEGMERAKKRILEDQATDADKFYLGLALLMPLLVGGLFGKEAGLGALGGAAKGVSEVISGRQKRVGENEKLMADLNKLKSDSTLKRGEMDLEKLKFSDSARKNLPKDEFEDLKGMKISRFKDPKTGKIVSEGAEMLPELYVDLNYMNTKEKRKEALKDAKSLSNEKSKLLVNNKAMDEVIDAASQLKDSKFFGKMLAIALGSNPATKKIMKSQAPSIMVDGREQNAYVYIDSRIEQMKDAYRRSEQMKNYTETIAQHVGSMIDNPAYTGLTNQDLIDQLLTLNERAQSYFVEEAKSLGFLEQPIEKIFKERNNKTFSKLNRREEKKELVKDKELMIKNN